MIGEAVDQQSPPHLHFIKFGWNINGGFLILANANQLTEPLELIQIMHATAQQQEKLAAQNLQM